MALHHYAAYKLGAWSVGLGAGVIFAFIEKGTTSDLRIALIGGGIATIPPTIIGLFNLIQQQRGFIEQRRDRTEVKEKLDGILSKAQTSEQAALKRADHAEGRREGVEAEQDREKP
jgi:hypothetical protein